MARRVFFSFHYERDIWRVNVVRNSWITQEREAAGFWDASLWETSKKEGDHAIRRMIDRGLENTSVTAVLIGKETADRPWVQYEIQQSNVKGNGILGVYIHNISDQFGNVDTQGDNPFSRLYLTRNGCNVYLSDLYPTYLWFGDDGYKNFGTWIENAARAVHR
jgi:hypothetical protein